MRAERALLAIALLAGVALAGCHGGGDHTLPVGAQNESSTDPATTGNDRTGEPHDNGAPGPDENETRPNNQGNGTGNGGGEGGDGNETQELACHEHDPPAIAHPDEQRVASPSDVKCPGHHAIRAAGGGAGWEAPVWEAGDWWRFRVTYHASGSPECSHEYSFNVTGAGTFWEQPIYEVTRASYECDGPYKGEGYSKSTQDHLTNLQTDGFIFHETIFPLKDGEEWTMMLRNSDTIAEAEVTREPNFLFGTETVEAYRIEISWGGVKQTTWWGVDVDHVLRIDWGLQTGVLLNRTELVDWSDKEDGGILPPGIPNLP